LKLEWMGRYRELVRMIIKYNNLFSRIHIGNLMVSSGVPLTAQQWQTLECVIEYEDGNFNMAHFAKQLGLPRSTFSKHVNFLMEHGFVEKYQQSDNSKNIILKPTQKGRSLYKKNSTLILEAAWKDTFEILDGLTDEQIDLFTEFMEKMAADLEPENNRVIKLMKLS
jgi:DNA-binding MarR family transcriptional regulator